MVERQAVERGEGATQRRLRTIEANDISPRASVHPTAVVENSVIGLRCVIGEKVTIRNSVIMGADYYETENERNKAGDRQPIGIGEHDGIAVARTQDELTAALNQAIIDQKNGVTTLIEALINQELGDPFRRDAMKKPVRVAGIDAADMAASQV